MTKRLAILGSTGSIGRSAVEVVDALPGRFEIVALSTHGNIDRLQQQQAAYDVKHVAITSRGDDLAALIERSDPDVVLLAVVGAGGVRAAIQTVSMGKTLALANKESLVIAGEIVTRMARQTGATILPVDSEHSAMFQAMLAGRRAELKKLILTASGGPFLRTPVEKMQRATPEDALNHPTWQMGKKVTIDSATMVNKAFELIEACWLFDVSPDEVEVVVHPQSIIHSMAEFVDGSVLAQLSPSDMRLPIQYALTHPDRLPGPAKRMDFCKAMTLAFEPPDLERFPALKLGYHVARHRGTLGAVFNAASEIAVNAFLDRRLAFGEICSVIERTIESHRHEPSPDIERLLAVDHESRAFAQRLIESGRSMK